MEPHVFKLAAGLMWMKVRKGKRVVAPERSHDRVCGLHKLGGASGGAANQLSDAAPWWKQLCNKNSVCSPWQQ